MPFFALSILASIAVPLSPATMPAMAQARGGAWCASLGSPGGDLAFGLELAFENTSVRATLVNGAERIEVPSARFSESELVLEFPHYDATVRATLAADGSRLVGEWKKRSGPERWTTLPFAAVPTKNGACDASGPRAKDGPSVDGRWTVKFSSSADRAVGLFRETSTTHAVEGTFLTTTGDYRYLAGAFESGRLRLSCFDGTHAFLFDARTQVDGTLKGDFYSGDRWHETWTATRDAAADLPDVFSLAKWSDDFGLASLDFPDASDGRERCLAEPELAGKARIVQILGSWCPNCHDETHDLAELDRKYRARGLSIVGLAFELTGDFARDAEQVRRTAKRHGAEYPMLLAGVSGGDKPKEALPALRGLFAFPTTVFLHRDGRVRAVHSGFAGPGTGEEHTKLRAEFEKIIEELLDEPAPEDSDVWKLLASDDWRNERDHEIVRIARDDAGKATFTRWEALRFDRPTRRDPIATGDVAVSGTSVMLGSEIFQVDRRASVLLDARDVGHRLTPATRSPFPIVDGKSTFDPDALIAATKDDDPLLRREAIVYATIQARRHELEAEFDPTASLADADATVRAAAAWSAGQLKLAGARGALIECTSHGYAPLRREAARALGLLVATDSAGAAGRLEALTRDYDPLVREAAKDALAKIGKH
jgi:thiol-disulfide isomerase/thioredoxin